MPEKSQEELDEWEAWSEQQRRQDDSPVESVVVCKCGGGCCVCAIDPEESLWLAHCMDCDRDIKPTKTKREAINDWYKLNT